MLEVNALPSLEPGASLYAAAAREGLDYGETLHAIVESAARRQGLVVKPGARRRRPADPLRIGFTFNVKRVDPKAGNDAEAEYDAPETIDAIREALEGYGHVTLFEATAELPRQLMQTPVDLVFNIAEGVAGRNREAAVPALCELMGIPYTGSDAATLSIALDKALSKRVLLQHGILTAEFQVMETGPRAAVVQAEVPAHRQAEPGRVVEGRQRVGVGRRRRGGPARGRARADRSLPPAGADRGVHPGREFTVGLLGDRRPRVLPPMEILFKDKANARPVYDFQIKQEWEKHVSYQCPAQLSPAELKAVERVCRETFAALELPRRRARRSAHDGEGRDLRHRGEPAARADAGVLGPVPDRAGGGHRIPHADRRDPRRRAQAAAREAARSQERSEAGSQGHRSAASPATATAERSRRGSNGGGDDARADGHGTASRRRRASPARMTPTAWMASSR